MALHSKADFAKLCGLTTGNLTNYIKRNKVLMSGDYIDDQLQINKDFLLSRQSKSAPKHEPPLPVLRSIRPDTGDQDEEDDDYQDDDGPEQGEDSGYALNKKKLKKQIAKLEVDTRLQELKEEKMRGELIPVDLVINVFRSHTQSIVTSMKDGIEDLLINFSVEARLKGDQLASLRGKMVGILNTGVEKSVIISNRNFNAIREQVKVKKDVGEHG
jgi:hypothetical protein